MALLFDDTRSNLHIENELVLAIKTANFDVITYLIEHGAYKYVINNKALMWAIRSGNLNMVKYFVETHKADVHANDIYALATAAQCGHLDIVIYLIEVHNVDVYADDNAILAWVADGGHLDVLKYLVDKYDMDVKSNYRILTWSALHGQLYMGSFTWAA